METGGMLLVDEPQFETMNETDVREVIVRPLLERLGYRHGTQAPIRTEVPLRYDKAFLGRKKPSKDPPLRGKADYVCDAVPYGRWVVEVKSPAEVLTRDDREQTHTYAAHPEIAAAFFMLTNGRQFELYRTSVLDGPVLTWSYAETEDKLLSLFNLVGPAALEKLANLVRSDPGKPLGPNVTSSLRILGGSVVYEEHTSTLSWLTDAISGLSLPIVGGFVRRTDDGRIHANVEVANAAAMMRGLNAAMGIDDKYDFYSAAEYLSVDLEAPTIFQNFVQTVLPKGTMLAVPGLPRVPAPFRYEMKAFTEAVGFIEANRFKGTMTLDYDLSFTGLQPMMRMQIEMQLGLKLPERATMLGVGSYDLEVAPA
jgi:hypothetical protein